MLTIETLKAFGANADEGLARCMNNQDFYFRMIRMAVDDAGFDKLKTAIEAEDLDTAFEAAHALKGILTNLSLDPISNPVIEATELLRSRTKTDYTPYVEEALAKRDELTALLA